MTTTCDTSVLVAVLASWHEAHAAVRSAVRDIAVVPAHVLVETYSVLTRLPGPERVPASAAATALASLAWTPVTLPAEVHLDTVQSLAAAGISGGAANDGIIADTAAHHGLTLLTRDARARRTYDALDVSHRLV